MIKVYSFLIFFGVMNLQQPINENLIYIVVNDPSEIRMSNNIEYEKFEKKYIGRWEIKEYQKQIKRIDISNVNEKRIPKDIKFIHDLEYADFSSFDTLTKIRWPESSSSFYFYHIESKINKLPNWISNLKKIRYLNLVGHNRIKLNKEIKRLKKLPNLKKLEIEIRTINSETLKRLCSELNLIQLKIHKENITQEEERTLQEKIVNVFENIEIEIVNIERYKLSK